VQKLSHTCVVGLWSRAIASPHRYSTIDYAIERLLTFYYYYYYYCCCCCCCCWVVGKVSTRDVRRGVAQLQAAARNVALLTDDNTSLVAELRAASLLDAADSRSDEHADNDDDDDDARDADANASGGDVEAGMTQLGCVARARTLDVAVARLCKLAHEYCDTLRKVCNLLCCCRCFCNFLYI
jgi:hypothetical protein